MIIATNSKVMVILSAISRFLSARVTRYSLSFKKTHSHTKKKGARGAEARVVKNWKEDFIRELGSLWVRPK